MPMQDRGSSNIDRQLPELARAIDASYADGLGVNFSDGDDLPRRSEVIPLTEKLLEMVYPGFEKRRSRKADTVELLREILNDLTGQIRRAMRHYAGENRPGDCRCDSVACPGQAECAESGGRCEQAALALLKELPEIRRIAKLDVAAAYVGDPAAANYDEIILSYPGLKAITIQRLAHVLYRQKIPLIPFSANSYTFCT